MRTWHRLYENSWTDWAVDGEWGGSKESYIRRPCMLENGKYSWAIVHSGYEQVCHQWWWRGLLQNDVCGGLVAWCDCRAHEHVCGLLEHTFIPLFLQTDFVSCIVVYFSLRYVLFRPKQMKLKVKWSKENIAVCKRASLLRELTCHMVSHSVTCDSRLYPGQVKLMLSLATLEWSKAD